MTLNKWLDTIQKLIKENPEIGDYPLIYSKDDEGNEHHKVIFDPSLAQVKDINEYNLELVGFKGDEDIYDKDCNVICIN